MKITLSRAQKLILGLSERNQEISQLLRTLAKTEWKASDVAAKQRELDTQYDALYKEYLSNCEIILDIKESVAKANAAIYFEVDGQRRNIVEWLSVMKTYKLMIRTINDTSSVIPKTEDAANGLFSIVYPPKLEKEHKRIASAIDNILEQLNYHNMCNTVELGIKLI